MSKIFNSLSSKFMALLVTGGILAAIISPLLQGSVDRDNINYEKTLEAEKESKQTQTSIASNTQTTTPTKILTPSNTPTETYTPIQTSTPTYTSTNISVILSNEEIPVPDPEIQATAILSFPCESTIRGEGSMLNEVKYFYLLNSPPGDPVRRGSIVSVLKKHIEDGDIWYQVQYEQSQGWIRDEFIILSELCLQ